MKEATLQEYLKAIGQYHTERRIISGNRTQDVFWTICGRPVATKHVIFTRKNSNNIQSETFTIASDWPYACWFLTDLASFKQLITLKGYKMKHQVNLAIEARFFPATNKGNARIKAIVVNCNNESLMSMNETRSRDTHDALTTVKILAWELIRKDIYADTLNPELVIVNLGTNKDNNKEMFAVSYNLR